MSKQTKRLAGLIEREISEIVRKEAGDARLKEVTITDVELSNDKSVAKVFYTVLNEESKEPVHEALEKAIGFIRSVVAEDLDVRKVPELRFTYDESIAHGARIEEILEGLKK